MPVPPIPPQPYTGQGSCSTAENVCASCGGGTGGGGLPDLDAVITALAAGTDEQKTNFNLAAGAASIYTPFLLAETEVLMETADKVKLVCDQAKTVAAEQIITPGFVTVATEAEAGLFAVPSPAGTCVAFGLALAAEWLKKVETDLVTIDTQDCTDEGEQYRGIQTPVIKFESTNQGNYFAAVMRKLDLLLRCCNPCDPNAREDLGAFDGSQQFVFDTVVQSVDFVLVDNVMPVNSEMWLPTFHKYGKFVWIYGPEPFPNEEAPLSEYKASEVFFLNSDAQSMHALDRNPIGFRFMLEPGITMHVYMRKQAAWRIINPEAPPP